jgi:hypothetical protein
MARLDFYMAAFLAALGTVLCVLVVIALWPFHVLVGLALFTLALGVVGARLYFWFRHHMIDLIAHRNRAIVLHDSESGFAVLHEGQVKHYSHTMPAPERIALPEAGVFGPEPEPVAPAIPQSFADMVRQGYVRPGMNFTLAFDERTGEALQMPAIKSLGISGVSGSGKTVTTLALMLQAVARYNGRVRFLVVDPHMYSGSGDALYEKVGELEPFFLTLEEIRTTVPTDDHDYHALLNRAQRLQNPTDGGSELALWLKLVAMEQDRRLHRGKRGLLWVVVIDEFAAVMADNKVNREAARVLEDINRQARKVDMFSLLVSQEWLASRTGGSELRHSAAAFVLHNTPESVASLIVPADVAGLAPRLANGEVIVYSNGSARRGRVPLATPDDAVQIVNYYAPYIPAQVRVTPVEPVLPEESEPKLLRGVGSSPGVRELPEEYSWEDLEAVRKAFLEGLDESNIARAVFDAKSGPELKRAEIKVRGMLEWMVRNASWQ